MKNNHPDFFLKFVCMSHNHSIVCDSRSVIYGNRSTPYGSRARSYGSRSMSDVIA